MIKYCCMVMAVKRVAVIGAGVSGIVACKELLQQGFDVTCFEMHDDIGGIWYFTEELRPDEGATTYEGLVTNSDREMMRYSDFNFSPTTPPFLRQGEYHQYLKSYADHFDVTKKVQLNSKILSIDKADNYTTNGRWVLKIERKGMGNTESVEFDAVIVSSGYLRKPFIPEIDDFDKYEGSWSHMKTFKSGRPFSGKRVLVIGNGNSALDAATIISDSANQVYLSVGRGCWVLPRFPYGLPHSLIFHRRFITKHPVLFDWIWRRACANYFDHKAFGIRPALGPLHFFATVCDDLRSRIGCGKIKIVSGTKQFTNHGVQLEDGMTIDNIDHVLFATGFQPSHDLLDKETMLNAYKFVFPVNLPHTSLAMVGMVSATGALTRVAELQARFAALVMAGKHKLPDKNKMEADIRRKRAVAELMYGKSLNSGLSLADDIAREIGVYPDFWKAFLISPTIAFQSYFGPAFPSQYRLLGEGSTNEAIYDCLNAWKNSTESVKLRDVPPRIHEPWGSDIKYLIAGVMFICSIVIVVVKLVLNCF